MKALVTGGAGFIGSHVVDALLKEGLQVSVIDNLSSGKKENLNKNAELYVMDIRDPDIKNVFAAERPDILFHLAAQISVSLSVREPLEDASCNIIGPVKLLEHCVGFGVKKVVFSSSGGTVYGEVPSGAAPENTPFNPYSPYGISKVCFEYYLKFFHNQHGLKYTSLRYGNVFGPRQDPRGEAGVVAIFTEKILSGETPVINGDGKYLRDYVFVEDVARANIACIDRGDNMAVNIGTAIATDVNEIYSAIADTIGFKKPPLYGPSRAGDLRRSALDISLAKKELDWSPSFTVRSGMIPTADFFKSAT